jgi:UDP-N-acetyl-D-mannosaminuronate dehydrogenase
MGLDITVIGLGEVGSESFKELTRKAKTDRITGVDISKERLDAFHKDGYRVSDTVPPSDVYIVATYTTAQVKDVLTKLNLAQEPLVSIESTLDPNEYDSLVDWGTQRNVDLVTCPHRFNPNDPAHYVFNLDRVIGGVTDHATSRGIEFYTRFMPKDLLHSSDFTHAALTKVVENFYRAMEIILAQEMRMMFEEKGYNFNEIKRLTNTKWNIDIRDALKGVGGKCLPKDTKLILEHFKNPAFSFLWERNDAYKLIYGTP